MRPLLWAVMSERLYFRQLLSGRDFAVDDPVAAQMVNFVYLIGDTQTREVVVVDPAYAVRDLVQLCEADDMKLIGVLATHFHPDHIGGDLYGNTIEGVVDLLELQGIKVHAQRDEAPWIKRSVGLSDTDLELHDSGDKLQVGEIDIQLIHTPGHTPGSQCFLVNDNLVAGDTLFLQGCGRTDLPGGDSLELYRSVTQKLAHVPDDAILFPGHLYAPEGSASMGTTRRSNFVFKPKTEAEWMKMFGGTR